VSIPDLGIDYGRPTTVGVTTAYSESRVKATPNIKLVHCPHCTVVQVVLPKFIFWGRAQLRLLRHLCLRPGVRVLGLRPSTVFPVDVVQIPEDATTRFRCRLLKYGQGTLLLFILGGIQRIFPRHTKEKEGSHFSFGGHLPPIDLDCPTFVRASEP
jgi:hypothetical protein